MVVKISLRCKDDSHLNFSDICKKANFKDGGGHKTSAGALFKSIEELKRYGIKCRGADKGQGSVEHGEKWLDEREEIIIDPVRCPNTAREWENIDYAVDKDGNPKDRLMDKDNHSIDSIRYGLQDEMDNKRKGMRGKAFGG